MVFKQCHDTLRVKKLSSVWNGLSVVELEISFQTKTYSYKFPGFSYFIQLFPFEIFCPYHAGGAGPFGSVQDVFRGSQGLFRSFKDRKITREVVGAPLAILLKN